MSYRVPTFENIQRELLKRKLEGSLKEYVAWYFQVMHGDKFIFSWHHDVIIEHLVDIYEGRRRNLIINIAPRYSKTEIVVKAFISWCFAVAPKCKFIHLSYSDDLALDNSSQIKEIVTSQEYQDIWPIELKTDSKSKKKWYTTDGGGVYATSTGGQITGFGAGGMSDSFEGAIVIDDPIKPTDAHSETIRGKINDRFNNTIKSRLNNPKKTPIIVIMQRVHEDDMTGFLLGGGSEFEFDHLCLPSLNEDGPSEHDPRDVDEALWPEKHTTEMLKNMEDKAPVVFAGQYQQRPAPQEGISIKRSWIKYWTTLPEKFDTVGASWDFTFKKSTTSDYVVGQVWGVKGPKKYLLDQTRDRMNFTEALAAIKQMNNSWPECEFILVEEKANGAAIIDSIELEMDNIIAINPTESKEARLMAVSPLFKAGSVYYPEKEHFTKICVEEVISFPNAKHDDTVDATSQFLNYMRERRSGTMTEDRHEEFETIVGGLGSTNRW